MCMCMIAVDSSRADSALSRTQASDADECVCVTPEHRRWRDHGLSANVDERKDESLNPLGL